MPNPSEEKTEDKIIKSFKKLVNEYSFDKITVTMIAEDVGISRPIFYRHFKDKYELMDYMLYNEVTKELEVLLEHNMILEAIKYLFTHIINEAKLYRKLFETTGQNSFEQVMIEQFTSFFKEHLKIFDTDQIPDNPMLSPLIICKYLVMGLTVAIKGYLRSRVSTWIRLWRLITSWCHTPYSSSPRRTSGRSCSRRWIEITLRCLPRINCRTPMGAETDAHRC